MVKVKYLLIAMLALLAACKRNPMEQAIIDYEQAKSSATGDLKIDIVSLVKEGEVDMTDSINYVIGAFIQKEISADSVKAELQRMKQTVYAADSTYRLHDALAQQEQAKGTAMDIVKYLDHFKKKSDSRLLMDSLSINVATYQVAANEIDAYLAKSGAEWRCTYKWVNPQSGEKEEVTKIYVFAPDGKIVSERK